MASSLSPQAYGHMLRCLYADRGVLTIFQDKARCQSCGREFKISEEGILEFVVASDVDAPTAQELKGNIYRLTPQQIEQFVCAERSSIWKSYYSCGRKKTMQVLSRYLDRVNCEQVFFLGAGTGREIEYLTSFRKFGTVFCSDLSCTALRIIPTRLAPYDLKVGLFTSDLQNCPVESKDIPIVIVNALHHTRDMHAVLGALLNHQYNDVFLVEPTNNFVIRFLAKRGIARRREYSGVIPGRLELPQLRAICRKYHYQLALRTQWVFPEDYYRKIFPNSRYIHRGFFWLMDGISMLTSAVQFGNVSVAHLKKLKS